MRLSVSLSGPPHFVLVSLHRLHCVFSVPLHLELQEVLCAQVSLRTSRGLLTCPPHCEGHRLRMDPTALHEAALSTRRPPPEVYPEMIYYWILHLLFMAAFRHLGNNTSQHMSACYIPKQKTKKGGKKDLSAHSSLMWWKLCIHLLTKLKATALCRNQFNLFAFILSKIYTIIIAFKKHWKQDEQQKNQIKSDKKLDKTLLNISKMQLKMLMRTRM